MSNYDKLKLDLEDFNDEEIWLLFGHLNHVLKSRGLVRTRNITGERGEFLTINTYNSTLGLPNLQAAPEGTQNIDAISRKGDRYSIKTITEPGSTTGVFHGLGDISDTEPTEKKFEYVVIVILDNDFQLKKMLELTWEQFIQFRKWHSTMKAWNLSVTKELTSSSKTIFPQ